MKLGAYDCGHYRSVGSAPHLRFDEEKRPRTKKTLQSLELEERSNTAPVSSLGTVFSLLSLFEADQAPKHYTRRLNQHSETPTDARQRS